MESTQPDPGPLRPRQLTWAALLGRWVEFARSALALPEDTVGTAMRESVPDIIMLQAVWFALKDMDGLTTTEHALGLDRAEVLIDKHADALNRRWAGDGSTPMPPQLQELIDDARSQLAEAERLWTPETGPGQPKSESP